MPKMDEELLLSHLQTLEQDSSQFVWGRLGAERERAQKEYFRMPYGNEEEGWSSIVISDVIEALQRLGHVDAAGTIVAARPMTVSVASLPVTVVTADNAHQVLSAPKKKAK